MNLTWNALLLSLISVFCTAQVKMSANRQSAILTIHVSAS